jgi:hypothetical protein
MIPTLPFSLHPKVPWQQQFDSLECKRLELCDEERMKRGMMYASGMCVCVYTCMYVYVCIYVCICM